MINDIWYIIYEILWDNMISDIFMCMNLSRIVILDVYSLEWIHEEKIWGKCQGQPLRLPMSKNLLQNKHGEQISVTSLNLQCAPVEKGVPSAVSSSLAASLKMAESVGAVCTWGYPRSDKAKWCCPNEHPFFSAELPVTWTQNQRNMQHLAPWKTNIRRTHQAIVKLEYQYRGPYKGTETHYVTMPLAVEHANLKRCCFHFNIQLWHILGITTGNSTKLFPSSSGFYSTPWTTQAFSSSCGILGWLFFFGTSVCFSTAFFSSKVFGITCFKVASS